MHLALRARVAAIQQAELSSGTYDGAVALTPDFPHYQSPQQPARRTLSRWWLSAAVGFVVLGLVATSVAVVVIVRAASTDAASYIDDPDILAVVERECDRMTKTVDGLTVTGTLRQQAIVIAMQDDAVQRMIDAIRAIDPDLLAADKPTIEWTYDWEQLISVRSKYAVELLRGHIREMTEPRDADGNPILDRMDHASSPECVVPDALLDPYPKQVEEVSFRERRMHTRPVSGSIMRSPSAANPLRT